MVARRSPCRGRRRNAHHPPDDDDDDVEVVSLASVSARRSRLVSYPPSTDSPSVRCPPVRPHAARADTNPGACRETSCVGEFLLVCVNTSLTVPTVRAGLRIFVSQRFFSIHLQRGRLELDSTYGA